MLNLQKVGDILLRIRDLAVQVVNEKLRYEQTFADWLHVRQEIQCPGCEDRRVNACPIMSAIETHAHWRGVSWCPRCSGRCVEHRSIAGELKPVYGESQAITVLSSDGRHTEVGRCVCIAAQHQYAGLRPVVQAADNECLMILAEREIRFKAKALANVKGKQEA